MTIPAISALSRYVSPSTLLSSPIHLTLLLTAIGLFFTAWFFVLSGWFSPLVHFCIVWTSLFKGDLYQVYQGDYEGVGHLCS